MQVDFVHLQHLANFALIPPFHHHDCVALFNVGALRNKQASAPVNGVLDPGLLWRALQSSICAFAAHIGTLTSYGTHQGCYYPLKLRTYAKAVWES